MENCHNCTLILDYSCFCFLAFDFLSVLCGHSFFSSPPQWPMTSNLSIPDFIHYFFIPILILQEEPVLPFLMLSAKQGNYWYHFYYVFGMTRSLSGIEPGTSRTRTFLLTRIYLCVNNGHNNNFNPVLIFFRYIWVTFINIIHYKCIVLLSLL